MAKMAGKPKTKKNPVNEQKAAAEGMPNPAAVAEAMEKLADFMGSTPPVVAPTPQPKSTTDAVEKPAHIAPTQAFLTVQKSGFGEQTTEKTLKVEKFVTEPASVGLDLGMTLNLGNYESARVSIALRVPCYKEEVNETFEATKKWLEERMIKFVAEVRKGGVPNGNTNGKQPGDHLF